MKALSDRSYHTAVLLGSVYYPVTFSIVKRVALGEAILVNLISESVYSFLLYVIEL